ncbi:hypothetical protein HMPREF9178_0640 [Streptococcus mitis bv. 2 str. F0392]|uniref:Uncharacterized protein n=1 Tax=Streptococcus mitis bv. 2 str. F0392 TaxID=768726 RepID=F9NZW1_STROR|nr:hypothetical protein HMPREF9178_0640 [Streptococcus mitis bv. 2 str. F0392]
MKLDFKLSFFMNSIFYNLLGKKKSIGRESEKMVRKFMKN